MSRYGGAHQALRRAALPYAYGQPCARCGLPMLPGQVLHLDHTDDGDPSRYQPGLFSHKRCNEKAGSQLGHQRKREKRERMQAMVGRVVLGIEISEDRAHTSIVAGGLMGDTDIVLVELVAYLDGTDAVPAVLELRAQRDVYGVVVDPMSNACTLLKPLEDAKVAVTTPATSDVKTAHGMFLDMLKAGRVRHSRQAQLTQAMRHLSERRLGGTRVFDRRGAQADVSPAVAAELACWGATTIKPPAPADIF